MTQELTPREACDEINRLHRLLQAADIERDAARLAQELLEARAEEERSRGNYHAGRADTAARNFKAAEARAEAAEKEANAYESELSRLRAALEAVLEVRADCFDTGASSPSDGCECNTCLSVGMAFSVLRATDQRQLALADAPVEGETERRIIPGPDGEL